MIKNWEQQQLFSRKNFFGVALERLGLVSFCQSISYVKNLRRSSEDPRLTARPHKPFRDVTSGESRLGPELDRGALLYIPEGHSNETPSPLAVFLHGGGGGAHYWGRVYSECDHHGIIAVVPESRARTWDAIGGEFGLDVKFLDSVLRYTFDRCTIDLERIALVGFSDGASYSLSLGPSNGDLFTHLVAFSPGGSQLVEPVVGLPKIFVAHGTEDSVLPVSISKNVIVPTFQIDGYEVSYREFEGGHELPQDVLVEALDWFMES
ncbi:MAG TPA: phospholipase [Gemmatimonadetes bacterium]|nr:phospholipase [Gemmatimonadota bacterium]